MMALGDAEESDMGCRAHLNRLGSHGDEVLKQMPLA